MSTTATEVQSAIGTRNHETTVPGLGSDSWCHHRSPAALIRCLYHTWHSTHFRQAPISASISLVSLVCMWYGYVHITYSPVLKLVTIYLPSLPDVQIEHWCVCVSELCVLCVCGLRVCGVHVCVCVNAIVCVCIALTVPIKVMAFQRFHPTRVTPYSGLCQVTAESSNNSEIQASI